MYWIVSHLKLIQKRESNQKVKIHNELQWLIIINFVLILYFLFFSIFVPSLILRIKLHKWEITHIYSKARYGLILSVNNFLIVYHHIGRLKSVTVKTFINLKNDTFSTIMQKWCWSGASKMTINCQSSKL